MAFAKIFGTDADQILVVIDDGADMTIRVTVSPPGGIVAQVSRTLECKDTPKARKAFRKVFDEMTETQAKELARPLYEMAGEFN